jgi:hypothetical protein
MTHREAWEMAYQASMTPKAFDVTLLCPECQTPLVAFSCPRCKMEQVKGKEKAKLVAGGVAVGFLQVLGSFLRPISSVLMKDIQADRQIETSIYAKEVLLAQRFQQRPETYDQAALCYMTWFQCNRFFQCPDGLLTFIQQYREANNVNEALRQSFLDVVFVKSCAVWSEYCTHPSLLTAASNHSEIQNRAAFLITKVEQEYRSRGANTTSMSGLVRFLSANNLVKPAE